MRRFYNYQLEQLCKTDEYSKYISKDKLKDFIIDTFDFPAKKCVLSIYFGPPGCGKTTIAAALAFKDLKKGTKVFSNVPITGTIQLEPKKDLGYYMVDNARILIDECSIEYNNRKFKDMPQAAIEFFKYHRHYQTAIDCFSQSWDDIDITLRRLAQHIYWVRRSLIPGFIYAVPISKTFDILDGEIIDSYVVESVFKRRYFFKRKYWHMFNTLSRKKYPDKEWLTW